MDKSRLSESDLCDKFIRPALERAGWDRMTQIYREYPRSAIPVGGAPCLHFSIHKGDVFRGQGQ